MPTTRRAAKKARNRTITRLLTVFRGRNRAKPVDFRVEIACYLRVNGIKRDGPRDSLPQAGFPATDRYKKA
jgi:hypothetical protein